MNERDAIEYATEHGLAVGVDSERRVLLKGKWTRIKSFRVGSLERGYRTLVLQEDRATWKVKGTDHLIHRRGAAIKFVVDLIAGAAK
jgi:hypothetical protein